jgi:hypothetical protein
MVEKGKIIIFYSNHKTLNVDLILIVFIFCGKLLDPFEILSTNTVNLSNPEKQYDIIKLCPT